MRTLVAAAFVLSFAVGVVPSQATWPQPGTHYYAGSIAAKSSELPIQLALSFVDDQTDKARVVGSYHYAHRGLPIGIEGRYDARSGELHLDEFIATKGQPERTRTGSFVGTAKPGCLDVAGTWTAAAGGKGLPFTLHLVAVERLTTVREPLSFAWDEGSVRFLGDGPLARAANERCCREARSLLEAGPNAARDEIARWLDASTTRANIIAPSQVSGGHRLAVHHCAERFVSLGGRVWEHTGGVHPNHGLSCVNLLERDGLVRDVKLRDLAAGPDAAPRLDRLVRDELRRLGATQVGDPGKEPSDLDSFDTFVMSPAGIVFGFAPFEVGSYAEGCYFVHLDWTQLRSLLVPPPELGVAPSGK